MSTNVTTLLAAIDLGDLFEMFIAAVVILGGLITGVIRHFRGEREVPVEVEEEAPRTERPKPKRPPVPRRPRPVEFPGTPDATFGPMQPRPARVEPAPPTREWRQARPQRKEPVTVARKSQERTATVASTAVPKSRPVSTPPASAEPARPRSRFALVHQPTHSTLRYAIVMAEVLGPPVALRPESGK